jgi:hypothetical protein
METVGKLWAPLSPPLFHLLLARPFDVTLARLAALSVLVTNQMLMQRGPQNVYPFFFLYHVFGNFSGGEQQSRTH